MRLILTSCLALFVMVFHSQAQSVPGISVSNFEQLAQQETNFMTGSFSLTPVQADSIRNINRAYYLKIAGLSSQSLSVAERGVQLQQIENDRRSRLGMNLTSMQYNQYLNALEAAKQRAFQRADSLKAVRQHH